MAKIFFLGQPWCLWKYPSDGSEHKVGDIEFTTQDRTNYNTLKGPFLKSMDGQIYGANGMSPALNWLCEIYDIDRNAAERILDRKNMKQLKKIFGYIPTDSRFYSQIATELFEVKKEVEEMYNDFLEQEAGNKGDTEYLIAHNWERILELLSTNEEIKYRIKARIGEVNWVHKWFVEDFGREPSESAEDLEWLADHILNFNQYLSQR